ncbi:MAG: thioredoxin family protein [Candidatus Korobacteraceae bacterium]
MDIAVYGPGCARCKETEKRVRHVAEQSDVHTTVTHLADPVAMAKAGVLRTPAVAMNGVIKVSGRIPEEEEIRQWLSEAKTKGQEHS